MSNSKLIIYFIKSKNRPSYYSSISFWNKTYYLKNKYLTIEIDEKYFNNQKEKIILNLKVIPADILKEAINYKINIFYGINIAYFFLNEENEFLIEYNYIKNQHIFYKDMELNHFDGNGLVKRLVLINSPAILNISNISLTFINRIILKIHKDYNSFEITDCDYTNSLFGIRPIKIEEKFNIINKMKDQKQELENLYNNLKVMINQNIKDKNEYSKFFNNYNIKEYVMDFSQNNIILGNEFKTNEDYYLMFLYLVWHAIKNSYLNEKYECRISIDDIFNVMNEIYNKYLNDKDLLIYEKILLLYSEVSFLLEKNDIKEYKSAELSLIKRKYIKNNSIYNFSFDFLKEFITKLNEKSYLFLSLLMLDCGTYYFNEDNEFIYGYNRESCDAIKNHLNDLIPDVFFEYSEKENESKDERCSNYKSFRIIFLNRSVNLKNLKKDPVADIFENDYEKKLFKHYGMLVSKSLMHELFLNKEILLDKKDRVISQSEFNHIQKKLVKIFDNPFDIKMKKIKILNILER